MTKRSQAIVVGALLGAVCSASLGLLGLLLTQDLNELADPVGWAILAALIPAPWGGAAGAFGAWFLTVRARNVRAFPRILTEATSLGGAIGLTMFAIGSYQGGKTGPAAVMWSMKGGGCWERTSDCQSPEVKILAWLKFSGASRFLDDVTPRSVGD